MNPKNKITFKSHWWSVNLPADWRIVEDNECITLSGRQFSSAVQISAARKETGFITDEDLREFASERLSKKISLSKENINITTFTGLYAERIQNGVFWREWWLRSGSIMLYVTYNIEEQFREAEKFLVDEIVGSLSPNG
jgi:hypothetical protein